MISGNLVLLLIVSIVIAGVKEGLKENKKKQRYKNKKWEDKYKKPTYKDFNTSAERIISPKSKNIDIPRNNNKNKAKRGIEYENHVAEIYRNRGYQVWERGKELGRKDGGIDLVAYKDDETILIQCKNWNNRHRWKIRQKDIRAFRTDCRDFLENNRQHVRKNIIGRYVISDRILDKGAYAYIKSTDKLDFEIIPSPEKEFTQPY